MTVDGIRRDGAASVTARPLFGRSVELSALVTRTQEARAGQARAVLVRGPAGIGKTALLAALRRDLLARNDFTVLSATCHESAVSASYGAVRALFAPLRLTDAAEGDEPDSPLLRSSARWALPALLPDEQMRGQAPGSASYQVLHGLYWLVANVLAARPLAIVLDDVQWCDERSLRWLDFLLRRADHLPLLVVLGQRTGTSGQAEPILGDLLAQPHCTALGLAPLGAAEVADLVAHVMGDPPVDEFVRSCLDVSGGNPLLLERLLGDLARAGVAPDDDGVTEVLRVGRDVLAGSASLHLAGQPEHVLAVARALAVLAGTLGVEAEHGGDGRSPDNVVNPGASRVPGAPLDEVGPQLVGELAGVLPRLVTAAVTALRRIDVIAPDGLDFVHDTVRSVVFREIPAEEAERLRAKAARLLNDAGRPAEEVANQLLLLPELHEPWMLGVLGDAAVRAELRGAPEAAVRYLGRVLDAGQDEPSGPQVRVDLARPLAQFDPVAALARLREALAGTTEPRARAAIAVQFGFTSLGAHRAPEGVEVLTAALDGLEAALGDEPVPADRELRYLVESALLITGADEKSTIDVVRARARAMSVPPGRTPAERQVLGMMSVLAASESRPVAYVVDLAKQAARARAGAGDWAMLSAALALHLADEVDASLAAFGWVVDTSREQASVWTHSLALSSRALVHYSVGDIREAAADAETSVAIAEQERWDDGSSLPHTALALALVVEGQPGRAEVALDRIHRPGFDEFVWEWHYYLLARARSRWLLGDRENALEHLEHLERSLAESGTTNPVFAPWWVDAACVLAELGRPGKAGDLVERWRELAVRWGTPRALGYGLLAQGVISSGTRAVDLLVEAVAELAASPARMCLAHAEFRLGAALLRIDDTKDAREHLRACIDLATRCGAGALTAAARRLHVAAGGRLRRTARSSVDILTGRERRVATMAAEGRSNREIAEALFVTVRTVEIHLTNTYRKLGVPGRPQLAAALADPTATGAPFTTQSAHRS